MATPSESEGVRRGEFAARLRGMGRRGISAYAAVDGEHDVDIPAQACRGRAGALGRTFAGHVHLRTGRLRLDCAEDPSFWLEVDLRQVPAFALQSDAPQARAAAARAREVATVLSQ